MLALSYCSTKTVFDCSGINELFKVVFLFFLCSCSCVVFVTLEKEKDLGENMLSRLCSDCLPFLQIGLFQANIDIFLDLLSCHHLARLFEVVVRRNLQKYVRGKVESQRRFCFVLTMKLFTFS